ncbi:MAG: histidine kinase [Chitinophagaceae bacterium]
MPRYLAGKNISYLIASIILLIFITVTSCYLISEVLSGMADIRWNQLDVVTLASRKSIGEQITIIGSAIILKVIKDYSLKQREHELREVENVRNELRLLKMQIHPRILFDCLQNIFKDLEAERLHAPPLILQLSELLGYFLDESGKKLVSLSVEVKMMQNYVQIKKISYGNNADISFNIGGNANAKYVTPGLFLPLPETFFLGRGYYEMPLRINLEVKIGLSKLSFYIKNNVPGDQILQAATTSQTLDTIKKRIKMCNPGDSKIEVHSEANSLSIHLQLEMKNVINPQLQNDENLYCKYT